ncbi:MAG: transcriptional regulator [Deltaproteobacteria bacterium]|nr:transcriptional regulator [Deltaproteobacteria bacterium]
MARSSPDADVLAELVGARLAGDELATALAAAPAADVALACACLAQEPTAHAAFDAILGEVDAAGASTKASRDQIDEVKQLLRVQLLVPGDKPPGIAAYRGRGPLRGWVRITAMRELIRHKKQQLRDFSAGPTGDDGLGDLLVKDDGDPVLEKLKHEYRAEFAGALREAVADLTPEDRILLRQQIVDQMSIDEVGAAYGVHRATAARWLNRARGALVGTTHKRLAGRLKMPVEEVDSVIRLVQSRLDISVIRFLRDG